MVLLKNNTIESHGEIMKNVKKLNLLVVTVMVLSSCGTGNNVSPGNVQSKKVQAETKVISSINLTKSG